MTIEVNNMDQNGKIGTWLIIIIGLLYLLNGLGVQQVSFMDQLNGFGVLFLAWGLGCLMNCSSGGSARRKK